MSEPVRNAPRSDDAPMRSSGASTWPAWTHWLGRSALWLAALTAAAALTVVVLVGIALAVAYPNLPEISGLMDYRPKLPMRIFSADGVLLGEYGEERRTFTPLSSTATARLSRAICTAWSRSTGTASGAPAPARA